MKKQKQLLEGLVGTLEPRIGDTLARVTYSCLEGEIASEAELRDPQLYIGGELLLDFDGGVLVITWDENTGWPDDFSIFIGTNSPIREEAKRDIWDASKLPVWKKCVNNPLSKVVILGENHTPQAAVLEFSEHTVAVGSGYQHLFGSGDDLLIRDGSGVRGLSAWRKLWVSDRSS